MIDCNTKIGHFPFRQIKHNTAAELAAWLDGYGIGRSVVSSLNAVFYADAQSGNLELAREIQPFGDRFIPVAVINPAYPGWEKDLDVCIDELGMKGIEIFPQYHNYSCKGPELSALLKKAAERRLPVFVSTRLIDIRGRHWMDTPENLEAQDIVDIVSLNDEVNFVISGGNSLNFARKLKPLTEKRKGEVLYDFSRLDVSSFIPSFRTLFSEFGTDNIVFATCAPFQYPDVQLVKLAHCGLDEHQIAKITDQNILRVL
ncbi:MAG: amidohydrolase family protein [Clostridia bacterium]|nr:amidohydrolase family protein [Clostridia bacterium]